MKLKMLKNKKINFKELKIQDFEILSTLGNFLLKLFYLIRDRYIWKSKINKNKR